LAHWGQKKPMPGGKSDGVAREGDRTSLRKAVPFKFGLARQPNGGVKKGVYKGASLWSCVK